MPPAQVAHPAPVAPWFLQHREDCQLLPFSHPRLLQGALLHCLGASSSHPFMFCLLSFPMDCSPPGSSAHGIFQARILEWFAIPYSRGSCWPRDGTHVSCISCIGRWILCTTSTTWEALLLSLKVCMLSCFSCVQLCVTLWTVTARCLCLWDSPSKNTGVGSHALLQGVFPTQGSNPWHLFHWQVGSLPLVPCGEPSLKFRPKQII